MGMIEKTFNNLVSGKVFQDFQNLPYEGKKRTLVKTALAALAAGIVAGVLFGPAGGVVVAAVVGIAAFSYLVTRYSVVDSAKDVARGFMKNVSYQNDVIDDLIDEVSAFGSKLHKTFMGIVREHCNSKQA